MELATDVVDADLLEGAKAEDAWGVFPISLRALLAILERAMIAEDFVKKFIVLHCLKI